MKNFEFSKKVSQTEAQGTCVLQLIALMDVSTVRLSILTTMDNGRQQRPSNSPILLFAHLWSNASQLIMNPNQIRPLSNICQLDVSAAFSTEASTLYHIMWREEPFSHFICLINPPFFFSPSDCEDFDTRASGESRRFLSNYSECNRRKRASLLTTADVTESQQCEKLWRMQQFEVQLIVKSVLGICKRSKNSFLKTLDQPQHTRSLWPDGAVI